MCRNFHFFAIRPVVFAPHAQPYARELKEHGIRPVKVYPNTSSADISTKEMI
jgi:hypothetical protein